jgi:hypothetical protein
MTGITLPPRVIESLPGLDWQQCTPNEDEAGVKIITYIKGIKNKKCCCCCLTPYCYLGFVYPLS